MKKFAFIVVLLIVSVTTQAQISNSLLLKPVASSGIDTTSSAFLSSGRLYNTGTKLGVYINGTKFFLPQSFSIANDAVTYAKIQNVSAASRLLGRGDSGSGDVQEITLGTGLSMTGTTLSVALTSESVFTAVVTLTNSELKNLGTTPKLILGAPGAGKRINVIGCMVHHQYSTAAFTNQIALSYTGASGPMTPYYATLQQTASYYTVMDISQDLIATASIENNSVSLVGADSATGGGTAVVYITYTIID